MIAPSTTLGSPSCPVRILHLEDSAPDHSLTSRALKKAGLSFEMDRADTLEAFKTLIDTCEYDVILADYRLPGFNAMDAWAVVQGEGKVTPFILLSGTIGEAAAVDAVQRGISDYLHKDNLQSLDRVIRRALEMQSIKAAKEKADRELAVSERRITEFAHHLQLAIEKERAAIAREIHDDIGGSLAAVRLDLAWLSRHSQDQGLQNHIATATEMIQHAIEASQRIMLNMRPAILDQGLLASVQWLVQGFEERTNSRVQLTTSSDAMRLDAPILLTAYRTVQESLTNIVKHADGSAVRIEISNQGDVLTVEISDTGPGLADTALQKEKSFGLRGLQERAKTVNGWLDISSSVGVGTSITLTVPLNTSDTERQESAP
ncbi:ATP-binding protein [Rhodoferax saidenbachensis]|nr:ATP-binding protein [Rhodoferax saidenbachensis]